MGCCEKMGLTSKISSHDITITVCYFENLGYFGFLWDFLCFWGVGELVLCFCFLFLFLEAPQHMEFPGQGSNPSLNGNLHHRRSNARFLTHCAGLGIEPASQRSRVAIPLIALQQELVLFLSFSVSFQLYRGVIYKETTAVYLQFTAR